MSIVVEHIPAPTDDARRLIGELDAELNAAYSVEQRHGLSVERVFQPGVLFFIARLDGQAVGCGGIAFENGSLDFAEVKRMYVQPAARGCGVAAAILQRLVDEANSRGVHRVTLETGDAQLAAQRFYQKCGFTHCAAFGAYARMPAPAIERSLFMEKQIQPVAKHAAPTRSDA
jgi:putative acetyltransferase